MAKNAWTGCPSSGLGLSLHASKAAAVARSTTPMEPNENCIVAKENGGDYDCVVPGLTITNNCSDTLTFTDGWTNNGGKLAFALGQSGHYEAESGMQTSSGLYVVNALLEHRTV